ncbi:MAG: DUF5615 family PIN-like protein [Gemmataceae bacterium]|nr:DUF5615 family PIN-like protein [Gemmataceae bacterium]
MSVAFYTDHHVPGAVVRGLRRRGVDALTVQEDGHDSAPDPDVLDRAGALGRVLVTCDKDFLAEATARQAAGRWFVGVLKAVQNDMSHRPGRYIDDLELIAVLDDPADYENRVPHLPL